MQFVFHVLFLLNLLLLLLVFLVISSNFLQPSLSALSLSRKKERKKLIKLMMDSGNSGSMQSSSGGDDQEFDSRGESISSFINAGPHHQFGSISAAAPPQQSFLSHQNPNFFDPHLSHQSLDHAGSYGNDNDLIWSRGLRSDHNQTFSGIAARPHPQQVPAPPFPADSGASRAAQQPRNPKKRTRASRRAPTTVLTTDTTNFRQMVQEFTGIPAAPFSGGSPYSRRLDLFSAASALRSASHLDSLYPLRPAAHKILSPFSSSSPHSLNPTMIDATTPTAAITNPNNNHIGGASTSTNPNNFQLPGDHSLFTIHQQPPPLPLQLGSNPPMNFSNFAGFSSREHNTSAASAATRGGNDDLSMWKSGETARNNDGGGENVVEFEGRNINSGESQNYSLNLGEKAMENVASSTAEGTVASWICHSD